MANEPRKRRSNERWVDCNAARAAYDRAAADQRQFQKVSELGPGLLARIRGQEKGATLSTRLMQENSIRQFANICDIPMSTLLANGNGLSPLEVVTKDVLQWRHTDADADDVFQDYISDYKFLVNLEAPVRLTQFDNQQLQLLSEQYLYSSHYNNDGPDRRSRTILSRIAALLPALAQHRAVITDRTKVTSLSKPTTIFERTKAYKLTFPPASLAKLPGLKGMTVWISEANERDIEKFSSNDYFIASGCYLYLVETNYYYKVKHAPSIMSGRTALRFLLANGLRKNGFISLTSPPPEDVNFNKPDPLKVFSSIGAIPGPQREIISLYWPVVVSDDQMFTLSDGRRCRTYDLIGYPIFIVEP